MKRSDWFFKKAGFSSKIRRLPNLTFLVLKMYYAMTIQRIKVLEWWSADKSLVIDTKIREIEVVSKRIKSSHQGDSYKLALHENFYVLLLFCKESNTRLDSRVAIHRYKNVDWGIDWGNVADSFGAIQVWITREINPMATFWPTLSIRVPKKE